MVSSNLGKLVMTVTASARTDALLTVNSKWVGLAPPLASLAHLSVVMAVSWVLNSVTTLTKV